MKKYDECIGCGFCCTKAKCGAAMRLYPSADTCPALKWDDEAERHFCDLMTIPGLVGEGYRQELYTGEGCCMNLNSWRREKLVDRTKKQMYGDVVIPKLMQQFLVILGKQWISSDVLMLTATGFMGHLIEVENMEEEKAKFIANKCISLMKESRSSSTENFMG